MKTLEEKYPKLHEEYSERTKEEIKNRQIFSYRFIIILLTILSWFIFFSQSLIPFLVTIVSFGFLMLLSLLSKFFPLGKITDKKIGKFCKNTCLSVETLSSQAEYCRNSARTHREDLDKAKTKIKNEIKELDTPEGEKRALEKLKKELLGIEFTIEEKVIIQNELEAIYKETIVSFLKELYSK